MWLLFCVCMHASMFVRVIKMIECIYDMFDPPSFSLQMSINLLFLLVHSLRSLRKKKKVYDLFCQWAMKFINNKNFFSLSLTHSLHSTLSMMFVDNANWINQLNKIYWFIIVSCYVCVYVWEWWRNFLLSKTSEDFNSVNWSDID